MEKTVDVIVDDAICSLDKIETITKVLEQTMLDDHDFNSGDTKNMCAVLLREVDYIKSLLSNI